MFLQGSAQIHVDPAAFLIQSLNYQPLNDQWPTQNMGHWSIGYKAMESFEGISRQQTRTREDILNVEKKAKYIADKKVYILRFLGIYRSSNTYMHVYLQSVLYIYISIYGCIRISVVAHWTASK